MLDDFTPHVVYAEYERRKSELADLGLDAWGYQDGLDRIADELGIGVPPSALTDDQRRVRRTLDAKGERCGR